MKTIDTNYITSIVAGIDLRQLKDLVNLVQFIKLQHRAQGTEAKRPRRPTTKKTAAKKTTKATTPDPEEDASEALPEEDDGLTHSEQVALIEDPEKRRLAATMEPPQAPRPRHEFNGGTLVTNH